MQDSRGDPHGDLSILANFEAWLEWLEEVDEMANDQEELKNAVKQAVIEGMTAVLAGNGGDDVSPVATSRISEGGQQVFTRQPTPYVDFDTANLRAVLNKYDADVEITRQELVTAAQEMTAAQSRGALKELVRRIEQGFEELSTGLDQTVKAMTPTEGGDVE